MFTDVRPPSHSEKDVGDGKRVIMVDTTFVPDFIHYMHVIAQDKGADHYSDDKHIVQVKVTAYDVERFPNLRDIDHVFLVYRK